RPLIGSASRAPNSHPREEDLCARRRSASRFSSCASLSTIACWPLSRSIFPAATRAAYCSETEADMSGKKEALRDGDGIAALHGCSQAEVSDRCRARDQALFEQGPSRLWPQLRIPLSRRFHSLRPRHRERGIAYCVAVKPHQNWTERMAAM